MENRISMDEKELENIFNKRLQKTQEFEFREEDWTDLATKMSSKKLNAEKRIIWFLGGLIFLLILFLSGLYLKYEHTKKQLQSSQETIVALEQQNTILSKEQSINKTDTIYKTIITDKSIPNKKTIQSAPNRGKLVEKTTDASILTIEFVDTLPDQHSIVDIERTKTKFSADTSLGDSLKYDPVAIPTLEANAPESLRKRRLPHALLDKENALEETAEKKSTKRQVTSVLLGIKGGVESAINHSSLVQNNSYLVNGRPIEVFQKRSWNLGLATEITPIKKITIGAGIRFENLAYSISQIDSTWTAAYGALEAYGLDLFQASLQEQALRYNLDLKYKIGQKSNLHPFIGLRAEASTRLNRRLTYDFSYPYGAGREVLVRSSNELAWNIDYLSPIAGVNIGLTEAWLLQFEAIYFAAKRKRIDRIDKRYGFNLGIFYQMK